MWKILTHLAISTSVPSRQRTPPRHLKSSDESPHATTLKQTPNQKQEAHTSLESFPASGGSVDVENGFVRLVRHSPSDSVAHGRGLSAKEPIKATASHPTRSVIDGLLQKPTILLRCHARPR